MSIKRAGRSFGALSSIALSVMFSGAALVANATPATIESRITSSADDAEESAGGQVSLSSSDLELTLDADNQVVGLRFNGLNIEPGATITSAYIQFAVDELNSEATSLQLAAQRSNNPQTFIKSNFDISARPRTSNVVNWSPAGWSVLNQAGAEQRTPELKDLVQEVVSLQGWQPGNSIAFIISGAGKRVARAFDNTPTLAPLLHIEYESTGNQAPQVNITNPSNGVTAAQGFALSFTATASDTEDGDLGSSVVWTSSRDGQLGTGASITATLSVGTHTITASVTDTNGRTGSAAITATIFVPGGSLVTLDRQVATGADDAEESSSGSVNISSADLELVTDSSVQTVGMRFSNITIPKGSVVANAWIQFTVDEVNSESTNLVLRGQASTNAAGFTTSAASVSSRPRTTSQTTWAPPPWSVVGSAGSEQRTPDLSAIINEIIGASGWESGNALAIIVTGTGKRVARAQNFAGAVAPLLHIEYIDSGANTKPQVNAGSDATITLPVNTYNLDGTVTDDGRPAGNPLTTQWTRQGGTGTGTVSFGNAAAVDTTFTVTANPGTYILRLTASDGDLTEYDDVTVTVQPQSTGGQVSSITQINYFNTGFVNLTSPLAIPATDPAGITYFPPSGRLIVADSEIDELSSPFSVVQANLFEVPLAGGSTIRQWNTTLKTGNEPKQNREPTGITYCENDGHFYVSNDDTRILYRYAFSNSKFTAVDSISLSGYADDAEDVTCDSATGRLYVIGGTGKNILVLRYQGGFVIENNLNLSQTAGSAAGVPADPEGIAFDPGSGHLFVTSSPDKAIFEYTVAGLYVKKFSFSSFSPASKAIQGIVVGPSSNNPLTTSFYLADGLVDNDSDPNERDGRIYEARINRSP